MGYTHYSVHHGEQCTWVRARFAYAVHSGQKVVNQQESAAINRRKTVVTTHDSTAFDRATMEGRRARIRVGYNAL